MASDSVGRNTLFGFFIIFFGRDVIDHPLNDHFLDIHIKAHETDKAEPLEKFLVFFICILEGGAGKAVILQKVLDQLVDLAVLHTKHFIINIGHILARFTLEIFIRDGL